MFIGSVPNRTAPPAILLREAYRGERLVVCRKPLLAAERDLARIADQVKRRRPGRRTDTGLPVMASPSSSVISHRQ